MTWKRRQQELTRLRQKHHGSHWQEPFPDLSVPASPCTNGFGPTSHWGGAVRVDGVTISHLHKSGYQVMLPSEAAVFGRKV